MCVYALSLPIRPIAAATRATTASVQRLRAVCLPEHAGNKLPRTSRMSRMEPLTPGCAPAAGFFNTRQRPFSHVGIYVGEGVRIPSSGKAIMVASMRDKCWHTATTARGGSPAN
jgi:hypothetical protein